MGLDHPDIAGGHNFDTDARDGNHIPIDPKEPCKGLKATPQPYYSSMMVSHGKRNTRMHKLGFDDLGGLYFLYPHTKRTRGREPLPFEFMSTEKLASLVRARGLAVGPDRNALLFQAKGDAAMRAWTEDHEEMDREHHAVREGAQEL